MKQFAGYIILHTCIKNHNRWCMVPEIRSETDIILCHTEQFFALLPTLPLTPMIPKIKILKKRKKFLEILSFYTYMCTINEDHIIWYMVPEIQGAADRNFRHFGPLFALQPLDNLENQNFNIVSTKSWNILKLICFLTVLWYVIVI